MVVQPTSDAAEPPRGVWLARAARRQQRQSRARTPTEREAARQRLTDMIEFLNNETDAERAVRLSAIPDHPKNRRTP